MYNLLGCSGFSTVFFYFYFERLDVVLWQQYYYKSEAILAARLYFFLANANDHLEMTSSVWNCDETNTSKELLLNTRPFFLLNFFLVFGWWEWRHFIYKYKKTKGQFRQSLAWWLRQVEEAFPTWGRLQAIRCRNCFWSSCIFYYFIRFSPEKTLSLMFHLTQNIQIRQQWRWACNLRGEPVMWFYATHNMGGLATPFTNHQQHTNTMSTANHSVSKYRNQAQKLEEKQSWRSTSHW